jgi:Domain of unknown function (DUF4372)
MVGDYEKPSEPSTEVWNMVGHASLFSQMLSLVDRHQFERFVRKHQAERAAKGFSCWSQFVAMMFCQLAQAKSLREIIDGLACCEGCTSPGPFAPYCLGKLRMDTSRGFEMAFEN